jgi:DNA-binding response OmpR family regulator
METSLKNPVSGTLNVLLVGNNPIELSSVLKNVQQVHGAKIVTEIAFDLKSVLERLIRFNPNFIFIDDNLGRNELRETINSLSSNKKTKDIPITVLKNSNYQEALGTSSILDYLLKKNLSPEAIYNTLKNSLKVRRTQLYLYQVYQKRKNSLLALTR